MTGVFQRTLGGSGLIALLLLLTPAGDAIAERVVIPDNIYFYQPVATVFGQTAIWNNPAALAYGQTGGALIFTQRNDRVAYDWGYAMTAKVVGFAYRQMKTGTEPNLHDYIFAVGGGKRTKLGVSYRYIKTGPGNLNRRTLWNVGLQVQNSPKLSVGARIENLNRGKINGVRSDTRYVLGLGWRPYADLVTASFEADLTSKEGFHRANYRTGVEVRPVPGLYLYGDFDNHSRFSLGVRVNLQNHYVGHYHNFDRDAKSALATSYFGSVTGAQPSLVKPKSGVMGLDLDGTLPENRAVALWEKKPLRFHDYIDGIYRAADDDRITSLFMRIGSLRCGMAKAEELARALDYFRSRDKRVVAYLSWPNNIGYFVASGADRVILPPVSELRLLGLRANLMTYKGLMDKIGIQFEAERIGEHKSYTEPYTLDRPSDQFRRQVNRLLDSLYNALVTTIAEHRRLSADSVRTLIDHAPLTSLEAVATGLADERLYLDEARKQYAGAGMRQIPMTQFTGNRRQTDRWGPQPTIAVIVAEGDITDGKSGGKIGEFEILGAIRRTGEDRRVKGLLLRINSPGGSALAGDLIWHELDRIARKKPVVVSMADVAASGGYYISCLENVPVFVDRSTVTGSIGIFAGKVNAAKLYDKIGVYSEMHKRGQNADMYSTAEPFTPEQRQRLREEITDLYQHFTRLVASSRGLTSDSIDALGRGQVWTGSEAVACGLADRIGGYYDALAELLDRTGCTREEVTIITLPTKKYLFRSPYVLPFPLNFMASRLLDHEASGGDPLDVSGLYARLPFDIEIE